MTSAQERHQQHLQDNARLAIQMHGGGRLNSFGLPFDPSALNLMPFRLALAPAPVPAPAQRQPKPCWYCTRNGIMHWFHTTAQCTHHGNTHAGQRQQAPAWAAAPVMHAAAPAWAPAPVMHAPAPAWAPAPVMHAPAPAWAPAPVMHAPAPAWAPAPVMHAPAPAWAPAPVMHAPVMHHHVPHHGVAIPVLPLCPYGQHCNRVNPHHWATTRHH